MYRLLIRRLLLLIPVIIGASFIIFFIINIAPGDVTTIMGGDSSDAALYAFKEKLGLNDPLLVQYGRYLLNLLKGDLETPITLTAVLFPNIFLDFQAP